MQLRLQPKTALFSVRQELLTLLGLALQHGSLCPLVGYFLIDDGLLQPPPFLIAQRRDSAEGRCRRQPPLLLLFPAPTWGWARRTWPWWSRWRRVHELAPAGVSAWRCRCLAASMPMSSSSGISAGLDGGVLAGTATLVRSTCRCGALGTFCSDL